MAQTEGRFIRCNFCEPVKDWQIPAMWTADYAMAWFHAEHLTTHVDELEAWLATQVPTCNTCRRIVANDAPVHRPCFSPECACPCSYTTTAPERTDAHAAGE